MTDERRVGQELLKLAVGTHLLVEQVEQFPPDGDDEEVSIRVQFRVVEEDLEFLAFPILFALTVLSFSQATPAGISVQEYSEDDDWSLPDMIEHLRYEAGRLVLSTDYVRGRRMKTDITIHPDGRVILETRGRGRQAEEWLEVLKGERPGKAPEEPEAWS